MRITGGLLDCLRWKSYQCAAPVPYDFASLQFRVFSIQHFDLGAYSYSLSGTIFEIYFIVDNINIVCFFVINIFKKQY